MRILDEIVNRVHNLTHSQLKDVLKFLVSLQGNEKRRHPRLTINTDIDAVIGGRLIQSNTRDISASGVYVRTTQNLEPGKGARVVFMIPNHKTPLKLKGKLIRTEPSGIAIKFEGQNPYLNRILDDVIWQTKSVYNLK